VRPPRHHDGDLPVRRPLRPDGRRAAGRWLPRRHPGDRRPPHQLAGRADAAVPARRGRGRLQAAQASAAHPLPGRTRLRGERHRQPPPPPRPLPRLPQAGPGRPPRAAGPPHLMSPDPGPPASGALAVIGVDGAPLPAPAREALDRAEVVLGAARHLDTVPVPATAERVVLGPVEAGLQRLAGRRAVVLASGDPGFFGIVRLLRERGHAPAVFPARSSLQLLFARIGRSWDDVTVVSAHGRDLGAAVNVCRARPAVAVLTAPGAGPAKIGAALHGWPRTLVVAEDLGGPAERVVTLPAAEAARREWHPLTVVLCLRDADAVPPRGWCAGGEPVPPAGGWALPDDAFDHRAGMVTKAEVRALALARLAPRPGALVWDVGAGSGSVAVECARLGAAALAVERRADDAARIAANAARHGVDVRVVTGEAP